MSGNTPPKSNKFLDSPDRGPAWFFHGRQEELNRFSRVLRYARQERKGTMFLLQGAPGAGKTALLHECKKRAVYSGWGVAHIGPRALGKRSELAADLGKSYVTMKSRNVGIDGQVGYSGWLAGFVRGAWGLTLEYGGRSEGEILRSVAKRRGLVLILDEAQDLQETGKISIEMHDAIRTTLRQIHNGDIGAPVVLLAGGLGSTARVLESFGISRFDRRFVHQLGSLSTDEGRSVLTDWLVNAGGIPADHENLPKWIDTLVAECHDWPQHLVVYAQAAGEWLAANGHEMGLSVPQEVLAAGKKTREEYYLERISKLSRAETMVLANLLTEKEQDPYLTKVEIIEAYSRDLPSEQSTEIFQGLLHKGVVAEDPKQHLMVPVPSMRSWLVREFADASPGIS